MANYFQLVAEAQRRELRTAFQISLIPSMVEQRGLPCASRYSVFIASISFVLMFGYLRQHDIKTLKRGGKIVTDFSHQNGDSKTTQNPTSLLINMRSTDTHQPKSTIFAHLLGLPCSLLPTKREINT